MNSSIKIALGEGNEPVIHFNVVPSDDLRDQLCCQFLHRLEGDSNTCTVVIRGYDNVPAMNIAHMLEIRPVSGRCLEVLHQIYGIEYTVRNQLNAAWTNLCVGGDYIYWENLNGHGEPNPKTTYSPKLNRRELELLSLPDIVQQITKVLESRDSWTTELAV